MVSHPIDTDKQPWTVPPVVERLLLLFWAVTWVGLIGDTWAALANTPNNNYSYLVPVVGYAVFLLGFSCVDYERGRGLSFSLRLFSWRTRPRRRSWRGLLFVLISFGLIAWMTQLNLNFYGMYFALLGQTLGSLQWRLGFPFSIAEIGLLLVQIGVFSNQDMSAFVWLIWMLPIALLYIGTVVALVNSRVRSEALVYELTDTKRQLEKALATQQEVAVLRERTRMAREMHDGLGHALSLIAVKIEAAQRLQAVDPARSMAELDATKDLARHSMAELRAELAELRRSALEVEVKAPVQALSEWATTTARAGQFTLETTVEPGIDDLPVPIQDVLGRVGREALMNVVKHASARHVELRIFCEDDQMVLSISDDGVGIPRLAEGKARLEVDGHYGVRGMRELLTAFDGTLAITPGNTGRGTHVRASVPMPRTIDAPVVTSSLLTTWKMRFLANPKGSGIQ